MKNRTNQQRLSMSCFIGAVETLERETDEIKKVINHMRSQNEHQSKLLSGKLKDDIINEVSKLIPVFDDISTEQSQEYKVRHPILLEPSFSDISLPVDSQYEICDWDTPLTIQNSKFSSKEFNTSSDSFITSISNTFGALSIDKPDNDSSWIISRNLNDKLTFHFNSVDSTPLSLNSEGIEVNSINLSGNTIDSITNSINIYTINNNTIPTTKALVSYLQKQLRNPRPDEHNSHFQAILAPTVQNNLDIKGRFVTYNGEFRNGLPECLPSTCINAMLAGYVIECDYPYVKLAKVGDLVQISKIEGSQCSLGACLVPGKTGYPTFETSKNESAVEFCVKKCLSMIKFIGIDGDKLMGIIV